jgi:Putative lumazine-binding
MIGTVALGMMLAILAQEKPPTKPHSSEQMGVRVAIEHYFKGHATGDASHMRKAFLPTAHIEGIRDGKFNSWTLDSYCESFKGKPAVDESARKRSIDSIDVTGTAAMVKATLVHGPTTFTDYFVLLKVDGEWKIANKVYHGQKR